MHSVAWCRGAWVGVGVRVDLVWVAVRGGLWRVVRWWLWGRSSVSMVLRQCEHGVEAVHTLVELLGSKIIHTMLDRYNARQAYSRQNMQMPHNITACDLVLFVCVWWSFTKAAMARSLMHRLASGFG